MLITGAAGNAGQAVCRALARENVALRMADMGLPAPEVRTLGEFVRCDTRTPDDVRRAVAGMDAVIHLAAWHSAHVPPVSDETIFAVNVDGTFSVLQACREYGVTAVVFASSMAYDYGSVYGLTKVIGEDLCRSYQQMTGASVVILRYHDFVPSTYLDYGAKLLRNGVDRQDVASSTVAALKGALDRRVTLFRTIVHTDHGMPPDVAADFARLGSDWCERNVPGARALLQKYAIPLPDTVEQHDLSEAARILGWRPRVGFLDFLRDLKARDGQREDLSRFGLISELPDHDGRR